MGPSGVTGKQHHPPHTHTHAHTRNKRCDIMTSASVKGDGERWGRGWGEGGGGLRYIHMGGGLLKRWSH